MISILGRALARRVFTGSLWVIIGKLLSSTSNIFVTALFARLLTTKELGSYFLLVSFVSVGAVFAQMGLDQTVVRLVAGALGTYKPERARSAAITVLRLGVLGAFSVGTIVALGSWVSEVVIGPTVMTTATRFAPAWIMVAALQNLVAETFRGFHDIRFASLFSRGTSNLICAILLSGLWIRHQHANLRQAAVISIVAGTATIFIAGYILQRKIPNVKSARYMSNKHMLCAAFPQLITNVTLIVNSQVALWILAAWRPQEEMAIYGAAVRLIVLVNLPIVLINSVLSPLIAELYAQRKNKELEQTLRNIATVAGIPSLIVVAGYLFLGKWLLASVYGAYYQHGSVVLGIMSIGQVANVWSGCCGLTLVMSGHHKTMMKLTLASGLFNAAAAVLLVSQYGVLGAAATTAASTVLQNVLMLVFVKRKAGVWTHARFFLIGRQLFAR
jgi:O-antigen/teichoic acid export membrane protein